MNAATPGSGDPAFLTVVEAAGFRGISRSLAYESAKEYLASGGRSGLRCIRLGSWVLITRSHLEWLARGEDPGDR